MMVWLNEARFLSPLSSLEMSLRMKREWRDKCLVEVYEKKCSVNVAKRREQFGASLPKMTASLIHAYVMLTLPSS
tara:strand:+ start:783 stop:1007 length:225 start_codon:yes stop_codon:yes gene_type:complete